MANKVILWVRLTLIALQLTILLTMSKSLMQDVDNLSKVPTFNILDSETRRVNTFLFTFLRRLIQMLTRSSPHHRLSGDRHAINGLL